MKDSGYLDYMTGLYNRKWLFERCCDELKKENFTILFMDLDNFKTVNDLYGHDEGDRVLKFFSDVLKNTEKGSYPVRMSGDEFVLIFDRPVPADEMTGFYNELTAAVKREAAELPSLSHISVSAGVNTSSGENDLQKTLNSADNAMYQAKREGKGRCVFFEDIRESVMKEKKIADEAPGALREGRFDILFDPLINLQSSLPEQTRAAVVLKEPGGEPEDAEEFRYVLEENGFIRELDESLLMKLFEILSGMDEDVLKKSISKSRRIRLSFEVSGLLLIDSEFGKTLKKGMQEYGIDPELIDIAVSEKAFAGRNAELLISAIKSIKELGVTLSIKDFGNNFSSIRYLTSIPVSTVRFDPCWLNKSLSDERERKILKSVIRMVKDLRIKVVAMGVTDKEGMGYLKGYGCDAAGIHGVSQFLSPGDYFELIRERIPESDGIFFDFLQNMKDASGKFEGVLHGDNVSLADGISKMHGAIHFGGGEIEENLAELPESLFSTGSYSIAFWIRPEKNNNWCSAVYIRYQGGFTSLVPYSNAENGISVFRISIDNEDFYDTSCRSVRRGEWNHLCVAYDASNETVRYFINGRKARTGAGMPVQIGCRKVLLGGDPFQRSFEGSISALCIYDYAITDETVRQLYDSYLKEPGYKGTAEEYWMDTE